MTGKSIKFLSILKMILLGYSYQPLIQKFSDFGCLKLIFKVQSIAKDAECQKFTGVE